jgi:hypothetical protein
LYNKTTCFEFHQLLVATLLSYGKALDKFEDALGKHKKQSDLQSVVRKADEVWTCSSLLWSIAYSRILENHLEILRQKRRLSTGTFPLTPISLTSKGTKSRKYSRPTKVGISGKRSTHYLQVAWPGAMRGDLLQVITRLA